MPDQFTAALELARAIMAGKRCDPEGLSTLSAELVRVSEENARLRKALESGAYPYPVEAGYGDVQERGPDGLSADECLRALEKR